MAKTLKNGAAKFRHPGGLRGHDVFRTFKRGFAENIIIPSTPITVLFSYTENIPGLEVVNE